MEAAPTASPVPENLVGEQKSPSFFKKNKFTFISVAVLIVALIPLIILTQSHKRVAPPTPVTAQNEVTPTPSIVPLTEQNVQPTIDATDQQIQQALDESQTEVNAVGQINTSSDSTTGIQ